MPNEQTEIEARTGVGGRLERIVIWLERHGVDCSRTANNDDAFVFLALIGIMAAFGLFAISPWWSGFTASAIIFNGKTWRRARRARAR